MGLFGERLWGIPGGIPLKAQVSLSHPVCLVSHDFQHVLGPVTDHLWNETQGHHVTEHVTSLMTGSGDPLSHVTLLRASPLGYSLKVGEWVS